jgi:hypothetical protein
VIGYEAVPRFAEGLRRVYGSEDLVPPGVTVDSVETSPELRFAMGERWWGVQQTNAAQGAGVFGALGINNPPGSKVIVVVLSIDNFDNANGVNVEVQRGAQVANGAANIRTFDSRSKVIAMAQLGQKTAGGTLFVGRPSVVVSGVSANTQTQSRTPPGWFAVLAPGDSLYCECAAANAAMSLQFIGYERQCREEETTE